MASDPTADRINQPADHISALSAELRGQQTNIQASRQGRVPMPSETTVSKPTNDNAPTPAVGVTISLTDLAKGLGRDEDDLLMQLAAIFTKRERADGQ